MNSPTEPPESDASFAEASFSAHAKEYVAHVAGGQVSSHAQSWYRTDTVGADNALRVRNNLTPLLTAYPDSKWLTVGDGGLGADAHFLLQHGVDALATDISSELLVEAKRTGHIRDYACENAEKLTFADSSFDFVLCKEAYHHFPRPYLALYEMLRVAREGVVLIEPADAWSGDSSLAPLARTFFSGIRLILGRQTERHAYEVSGNYLYTISVREMQKVALGVNLPMIARRSVNAFYRPGVETAPAGWKLHHPLFVKSRLMLTLKNVLSALRLIPYSLLVIVIFKRLPSKEGIQLLSDGGFKVERLPSNPYLQTDRR